MTATSDAVTPSSYVLDEDTEPGTDEANAQLLAQSGLPQKARYCIGVGWLIYDPNGYWKNDSEGVLIRTLAGICLRQTIAKNTEPLLQDKSRETYQMVQRWRKMGSTQKSIKAALEAACGKPESLTKPDDWDANPYLLNVQNGVLDLRSKELRPHNPDDLMTLRAGTSYDPAATHAYVEQLIEIMKADGRLEFLQRSLGSALCGEAPNEVLIVLQGEGGTGKGTLIAAVLSTLGSYGVTINVGLLLDDGARDGGVGPRPEVIALKSARLVVAGEPPKNRQFAAGRIKSWTGNDPISARGMYSGTMLTFKPAFKIFVHTNYPINASPDDSGLMRRLHVVEFRKKPEKRNDKFKSTLENDPVAKSAMLNFLLEGFSQWYADDFSLGNSTVVQEATKQYWVGQNVCERFALECLAFGPGLALLSSTLESAFQRWVADNNMIGRVSIAELRRHLTAQGAEMHRNSKERGWQGVGLK